MSEQWVKLKDWLQHPLLQHMVPGAARETSAPGNPLSGLIHVRHAATIGQRNHYSVTQHTPQRYLVNNRAIHFNAGDLMPQHLAIPERPLVLPNSLKHLLHEPGVAADLLESHGYDELAHRLRSGPSPITTPAARVSDKTDRAFMGFKGKAHVLLHDVKGNRYHYVG